MGNTSMLYWKVQVEEGNIIQGKLLQLVQKRVGLGEVR